MNKIIKLVIGFGIAAVCFFTSTIFATTADEFDEQALVMEKRILLDASGNKTYDYVKSTNVEMKDDYTFTQTSVSGYNYLATTKDDYLLTSNTINISRETELISYYVVSGYKGAFLLDAGYELLDIYVGSSNEQSNVSFNQSSITTPVGYNVSSGYKDVYSSNYCKAYMPNYVKSNGSYSINVINGSASASSVTYDSEVTVTSTLSDFTCWKIGGKVVSYNKTYTFSVYSDVSIEASNTEVIQSPLINVKSLGSGYYVCNFDLAGYTFVEAGMIFGSTSMASATKKIVANSISGNNEFAIYCTTSTYNAYLIYVNDSGVYQTVMYSGSGDAILGRAIFASANGSSSNSGTKNSPYDISTAISKITDGGTIYMLGGTYVMNKCLNLTKSGTKSNYLRIVNYNEEEVFMDFSALSDYDKYGYTYNKSSCCGFYISGDYWHIKGITVDKAGSSGIRLAGNNNIIENCVLSNSGNSGLQISRGSSADETIDTWPSFNSVINTTSYGSYDYNRADSLGEDADGFACKLTSGYGNSFDGCIANNNSDDGWDCFTKRATGVIGAVVLVNCIAFNNGYGTNGAALANGNGFKMGGRALEVDHVLRNCAAFNNKANGFDDNSNPGTITIENCTSYNNARSSGRNIAMGRFLSQTNTYESTWTEDGVSYGPISNVPMSHNNFKNVISTGCSSNDQYAGKASYTYFNNSGYKKFTTESSCNSSTTAGTSYTNSSSPFVSTTFGLTGVSKAHNELRNDDNSVYLGDFLKVTGVYSTLGENGSTLGAVFSENHSGIINDDPDIDKTTYSLTTNSSYFTIGSAVTNDTSSQTIGGKTYTGSKSLPGGLSSANSGRYISFTTTSAATVSVAVYNGGSTGSRYVAIGTSSNGDANLNTFEVPQSSGVVANFTVTSAGTYYIYSTGSGLKIFEIIVEE